MTDLASRVLAGDTRAAARLCRIVDDRMEGYRERLKELHGAAGGAYVVGVTGSPGSGKSTLVDALIFAFRARGGRVAVVAVDPTSPFSGGAVLGDRIRMQRHFEDPDVFIRSVATRGAQGGLSRSVRDMVRVLEGWGAGVVIVETVGVGQDELDVILVADSTIVVVTPGQGDDVQATKAGLLECADVFVVNKADRPGADAAVRDLESMLALGALSSAAVSGHGQHGAAREPLAMGAASAGWTPSIVRTVATQSSGVPELLLRLEEHRTWQRSEPGESRRRARAEARLRTWLRDELAEELSRLLADALSASAGRIIAEGLDPYTAVEELVALARSSAPSARASTSGGAG